MKVLLSTENIQVIVDDEKVQAVAAEVRKAAPEPKPEPKKPEPKGRKLIDHGKIVACYKGGRSVSWIADDMKISPQTVVNHLEKEGIYKKI